MSLWQDLLSYAITDPLMVTDSFKQGGEVHRRKVRNTASTKLVLIVPSELIESIPNIPSISEL
jgi:hypothetical protein